MKQIKKTEGSEFYTLDGIEFKGFYYVDTKTNIAYVYDEFSKTTKILVPKHTFDTETVRLRTNIKGGMSSPVSYKPTLSDYSYSVGEISRYFVQKRNSPMNTITEIDYDQFIRIKNKNSKNYIDSKIYNSIDILWRISGNKDYVSFFNTKQIEDAEKTFKGLKNFLKNVLEFYR